MTGRSALELLGWQPHAARNLAMRFRRHTIEQLAAMQPHRRDEARLVAVVKQGRQQLESLFAQEREEGLEARRRGQWSGGDGQ